MSLVSLAESGSLVSLAESGATEGPSIAPLMLLTSGLMFFLALLLGVDSVALIGAPSVACSAVLIFVANCVGAVPSEPGCCFVLNWRGWLSVLLLQPVAQINLVAALFPLVVSGFAVAYPAAYPDIVPTSAVEYAVPYTTVGLWCLLLCSTAVAAFAALAYIVCETGRCRLQTL